MAVAVVALLAVGVGGFLVLGGGGDEDVAAVGSGSEDGPSSTMDPGSAFAPGTLPATVPPPTTPAPAPETTPTTTPTTSAPPPTEPPAPPTPELVTDLSPTNDEHIRAVADFAAGHQQEAVRLELRWDDPGDPRVLDPQPDGDPALLVVRGSCPLEEQFCDTGMEILINDLNAVEDANLYYDNGQWVISGRFAVQGLDFNMGVQSVALRALPIQ